MGFGVSILLIAVGAVLKYAVTASLSGLNVHTIGLILMIVGAVGFILSILFMMLWRRDVPPTEPPARVTYREHRRDPYL